MRFLSTLTASVLGSLIAFGLLFFFFVFFLFALSFSGDTTPTVQPNSVLVVPVEGSIPERTTDDPFQEAFDDRPAYDLRDLQTALRNARQDNRISAVWLRMKGISASWGTTEEIREAVAKTKQSGVPVIASSEEFGLGEKDYYVASAADSIFAGHQSTFEYNGFATILAFFENAFDKLKIEPEVVRAGKYKSAVEPFLRNSLSDPNRQQIESLLSAVNNEFTETIADARGISSSRLQTIANEEAILSAHAADETGLIDGLRYEDEVRDVLRAQTDLPETADLSTIPIADYKKISAESAGVTYTGSGSIAVVYAEGNIVSGSPDENPFGPSQQVLGSTPLIEALDDARTSASTKGIVLRINSPGGSAAASEAMWRAVERAAEEKPLIVSMGGVAASGGYYIAAPADSIIANTTTTTGSIGVFGLLWNAQGLFEEKLGITFDQVSTSPYADMFMPSKPLEPSERRLLGSSIDQTYDTFLERVADGRDMDTSAVHDVAQGRIWSGRDAMDVGLVDSIGTLENAIAMAGSAADMGEGPYQTRILPRKKTFIERLSEAFSTQTTKIWQSMTATPLERTLWRHTRVLKRVTGTNGSVQARLPVRYEIE